MSAIRPGLLYLNEETHMDGGESSAGQGSSSWPGMASQALETMMRGCKGTAGGIIKKSFTCRLEHVAAHLAG